MWLDPSRKPKESTARVERFQAKSLGPISPIAHDSQFYSDSQKTLDWQHQRHIYFQLVCCGLHTEVVKMGSAKTEHCDRIWKWLIIKSNKISAREEKMEYWMIKGPRPERQGWQSWWRRSSQCIWQGVNCVNSPHEAAKTKGWKARTKYRCLLWWDRACLQQRDLAALANLFTLCTL
jgi:hypothetical protein